MAGEKHCGVLFWDHDDESDRGEGEGKHREDKRVRNAYRPHGGDGHARVGIVDREEGGGELVEGHGPGGLEAAKGRKEGERRVNRQRQHEAEVKI